MSPASFRRALLAPALFLGAGACFATRTDLAVVAADVQAVRGEVQTTRAQMIAGDSAITRALESAIANLSRTLAVIKDTVQASHATSQRLRGDVREDLQVIREQLIAILARQGESQRRIAELRAELEADTRERVAGEATTRDTTRLPGDPSGAATPAGGAAPATPGPAQMLQMAQDQLRRGSNGVARSAFNALLTQFPTSDLAPEALYGVAETYANEGNGVAADSVYNQVVTRFPTSDRAPTALYKRATALRVTGRADEAKVLYQQIVQKYPKSDAALLAEGFLGTRRP